MSKTTFVLTNVALIIAFGACRASHAADGKILIFSTPPERVAAETPRPKDPILFDSGVPGHLKELHLKAAREEESNDLKALNRTLAAIESRTPYNRIDDPDPNAYRFPVPAPASNVSDFVDLSDDFLETALPNARVRDAGRFGGNFGLSFDEEQWNETYDADSVECDNPELALKLKEYVRGIIDVPLDQLDENDNSFVNVVRSRAVVSWNGKTDGSGLETLIVSNEEESVSGRKAAMLTVVPLPGRPTSIARVGDVSFQRAKKFFTSKLPEYPSGGAPSFLHTSKMVGPHNIFVWELNSLKEFHEQTIRYVEYKYQGRAMPLIDANVLRVVDSYLKQGIRYFAFDLTEVGKLGKKEAIAYTFPSDNVYYPLAVGQMGGSDKRSAVDMIVMSPGKGDLNVNGSITELVPSGEPSYRPNQAELVRGARVGFSVEEIRYIDPSLDVFDPGTRGAYVRNVRFAKPLNGFTKDIVADNGPNVPQTRDAPMPSPLGTPIAQSAPPIRYNPYPVRWRYPQPPARNPRGSGIDWRGILDGIKDALGNGGSRRPPVSSSNGNNPRVPGVY